MYSVRKPLPAASMRHPARPAEAAGSWDVGGVNGVATVGLRRTAATSTNI